MAAASLGTARTMLSWLRTAGVEHATVQGVGKQVALTNDLSLIAAALYVLGLGSDLLMPLSWMVVLDVVALAAHLGTPVLNWWGLHSAARAVLLLLVNAVIFLATAAEGKQSGMQYLFPTFTGLPLALFDLKERVWIALGVALPVACFVVLEVFFRRSRLRF
jgi:hypothetical protein